MAELGTANQPQSTAGIETCRIGRRTSCSVFATVGALTLVANLACLYSGQENHQQRVKPTLSSGTAFPSAETIAQLAGLFPKDGQPVSPGRLSPKGADVVWSELLEATSTSSQERCLDPPCASGENVLPPWADLGDEMSHVEGAVVVRRPGLLQHEDMLGPANSLDYSETLRLYLPIFASSLISGLIQSREAPRLQKYERFLDAVDKGNGAAGRYLSPYYYVDFNGTELEVNLTELHSEKSGRCGYEGAPSLVAQADVFVHASGYVWNDKDLVVPPSCYSEQREANPSVSFPTNVSSFKKVFILNQAWTDSYYHFVAESLPRITLFLDVLLRHEDIKVALRAPRNDWHSRVTYILEFIELLGVRRERVVFIETQIHAELGVLPDSTPCGEPSAPKANMLRSLLLQALYPDSGGVPPPLPRPVILLIVRQSKRGLQNNREVRKGLERHFPDYDVVEFFGTGTTMRQLKSFATASVVVGPHGAGLANIMVSALHTPVVEIGPANCPTCLLQLAVRLQHIYARHVPGTGTEWDAPCNAWYKADVDEVVQLARDILKAKSEVDAADPPRGHGRNQGQHDDG